MGEIIDADVIILHVIAESNEIVYIAGIYDFADLSNVELMRERISKIFESDIIDIVDLIAWKFEEDKEAALDFYWNKQRKSVLSD